MLKLRRIDAHRARHRTKPDIKKEINFGWKQIVKSPFTSILGAVIILISLYTVIFKESSSWSDSAIGLSIGISLLFTPDRIGRYLKTFLEKP